MTDVVALARQMITFDSHSALSNLPLLQVMQDRLAGWEIERIDYLDDAGVPKGNLVARWPGSASTLVYAGHLDTVPPVGWTTNPFAPMVEGDNLVGLGAADMKGPIAAFVCAAEQLEPAERPLLILTADEETTKRGAREVVARSRFLQERPPTCFIVAEPTRLTPVRGHRVDVQFTVTAEGRQAHSSTGKGLNANVALVPFLMDLRALHLRLREDVRLHDTQYDPPFCDLNFVLDNHGALPNITVGLATCRIKFRYSKAFDPEWVVDDVTRMAETHGLKVTIRREEPPPELPPDAAEVMALERITGRRAIVMGLGTEASVYNRVAPTLVFGPGDLNVAHAPAERVAIPALTAAVESYIRIARTFPAAKGIA